ncbi:unnamed protein product [Orchesella dallaii]|uniref:Uncharacterized protein n=1 Tax=Orchesella dallaii TaxID=48710 RepID=A0ABP1RZ36_9HEXA
MSRFVTIRVTGPKTLVPNTLMRGQECDVNWTWLEFLNVRCQLKINASDQLIVRTASHTAGRAWQANLGDRVMDFINKYARIRASYTIRLTMIMPRTQWSFAIRPRAVPARRTGTESLQQAAPTSSSIVNTVKSSRKISQKDCEQHCSGCRAIPPRTKRTSKMPSSRSESRMELQPTVNSAVPSIIEGNVDRVGTTVAAGRQLERNGLANTNTFIKADIINRLMTLENRELLLIHDELQALVDKSNWCRLVYRVPRTGHFLSNIFRLRMFPFIEDLH